MSTIKFRIVRKGNNGYSLEYSIDEGVEWLIQDKDRTIKGIKQSLVECLESLKEDETIYETPSLDIRSRSIH